MKIPPHVSDSTPKFYVTVHNFFMLEYTQHSVLKPLNFCCCRITVDSFLPIIQPEVGMVWPAFLEAQVGTLIRLN